MTKNAWILIGLGLLAALSLRIYYFQEMLAALIVFSFLFVAVFLAALAMFLLLRTSRPIIAWAIPNVGRLVRRGADAVEGVIRSSVWARSAPLHLRKERLQWNENYRIVYSRFASLRPNHIYRIVMRVRGAALIIGLSKRKKLSRRLGNWLTQRVSYSDLIRLKSRSHVRPGTRRYRRASGG
jgi:hypothetical protein